MTESHVPGGGEQLDVIKDAFDGTFPLKSEEV